uniref:uncharacterized protein LOC120342865 n=1 Tax=Styela clava TaxID=7725 RepID=UPI00193958B5|nr:uncharacterized protein LOC120342865 [Styela clava]
MTAAQTALPLRHFYPQIEGSEHLSQNLASNEIFTPFQPDRITVSPSSFERYRAGIEKQPRLPWGRLRDYGGLQKVQIPDEFIKLKTYPPDVVQKGHRHYGSGASDPRDLAEQQFYDITHLQKSHVRSNDQLLPNTPSKHMNENQIDLPFPAESPYYSHTSRFALIPNFSSPDDPAAGDPSRTMSPLHANASANPYQVMIINKTKGSPYRRELQEYPFESDKKALTWNGERDFYQLMKSPSGGKQPYYPSPPKVVHPNLRLRDENQRIELRTANSLRNVERDQWKTVYQYNYTGYGESNAMHLDDYHKKAVAEITEFRDARNDELVPKTAPTFSSPRPQEGRYARLYQNRKQISAPIRYPDENPYPDSPDVMDIREYSSLPDKSPSSRSKDEWYRTRSATTAGNYKKGESENNDDEGEEVKWKTYQLAQTPDYGISSVVMKRVSEPDPFKSGEYDHLPKSIQEQERKAEARQSYLKDYDAERTEKFKEIDRFHKQRQLELQYLAEHDMHALRNKTDQMGNRVEPKAMDQHAMQSLVDDSRMQSLNTSGYESSERFDTGLDISTKKISDAGLLTDMHDRQLDGYKNISDSWIRDIPKVESPRQNHAGLLDSYVNRSNPFSLSLNSARGPATARTGEGSLRRSASTGSILKTPGSPPRTGASKSISFSEVVRVVSSEYGDKFRVTTSPLNRRDGNLTKKERKLHNLRSPTPLPTPIRNRREPSIHSNISPRGPVLRSSNDFPQRNTAPTPHHNWRWNYDTRSSAEFDPMVWTPRPSTTMPQTSLLGIQDNWTKTDAHRRFHKDFPEQAPDFRDNTRLYELADKSADLRFTRSAQHREKRHKFYGFNSYDFYNGNLVM